MVGRLIYAQAQVARRPYDREAFFCERFFLPEHNPLAWQPGWTSNHLLLHATVVQLSLLAVFLLGSAACFPSGPAPPHGLGFVIASLAFPAVPIADAIQKRWEQR